MNSFLKSAGVNEDKAAIEAFDKVSVEILIQYFVDSKDMKDFSDNVSAVDTSVVAANHVFCFLKKIVRNSKDNK